LVAEHDSTVRWACATRTARRENGDSPSAGFAKAMQREPKALFHLVIPAEAGIQPRFIERLWIPACGGMTQESKL
jgi:hypothetical protein